MGEVVEGNFGGERKRKPSEPISWDELWKAVMSTPNQDAVQKQFDTILPVSYGNAHHIKVQKPHVIVDDNKRPGGVLYPVSSLSNKDHGYVSSPEFAQYLENEEGLERSGAILLAASSIIAYTNFYSWARRLNRDAQDAMVNLGSKASMKIQYPEYWSSSEYLAGESRQSIHVLMHRAAARIALNVCGLLDIDPTERVVLPVHVAALADPLNDRQVAALHTTGASHGTLLNLS